MTDNVLEVKNLCVDIIQNGIPYPVLTDVSFSVKKSEAVGLVGESGSGKTVCSLAVMGLLPPAARVKSGEILFNGEDLLKLAPLERRKRLGKDISMVFQNPITALDPLMTVGAQIAETIKLHNPGFKKDVIKGRVLELMEEVKLPYPEKTIKKYPHELSGGQCQRIAIAQAIANRPEMLIADECTTALDATVQIQIIGLLKELGRRYDMALLFISHNLGLVKNITDKVGVMYVGSIVEYGGSDNVLSDPLHPYTVSLLNSLPELSVKGSPISAIKGKVPALDEEKDICPFHPRCPRAELGCLDSAPAYYKTQDNRLVMCHLNRQEVS